VALHSFLEGQQAAGDRPMNPTESYEERYAPCRVCTHTECSCDCSMCELAAQESRDACPCAPCSRARRGQAPVIARALEHCISKQLVIVQ
jgi:hypothetical protein